jgi:hypothetical protein
LWCLRKSPRILRDSADCFPLPLQACSPPLRSGRYGYFVDVLYYLACRYHLAWGYVDQPPLIAWIARTVFGQNYGQAGAIDFFGPKYGLPPAIGGNQNYFIRGPRGYTGESMIVLDDQ